MFAGLKMLMQPMKLVKQLGKMTDSLLDNKFVGTTLKMLLVLYAGVLAPKLPESVLRVLENAVVKTLVFFLIPYIGTKDPALALLIALAYNATMVTITKLEAAKDLSQVIDALVDGPQETVNALIDGAQTGVGASLKLAGDFVRPVKPVTDLVETSLDTVVDSVQGAGNSLVDMSQDLVRPVTEKVGAVVGSFLGSPLASEIVEEAKERVQEGFTSELSGLEKGEMYASF